MSDGHGLAGQPHGGGVLGVGERGAAHQLTGREQLGTQRAVHAAHHVAVRRRHGLRLGRVAVHQHPVLHAASVSAQTRSSTCAMVSAGCAPEIPYRRSMTKKGTPVTPSEWATSSSASTAWAYLSPARTASASSRSSPASAAKPASAGWSKIEA